MPAKSKNKLQTQVLIIGGGITGAGIARDLVLNGIACILVEKDDLNAGASGANHGLLHSGARYVAGDSETAAECYRENLLLKHLAPHCIEDTAGLFVAVEGDDEAYIASFPRLCETSTIPVQAVDTKDALEMEPALSDRLIAAYRVPDATVDPFKLCMDNIEQARSAGCLLLRHSRVEGFSIENGLIRSTTLRNMLTGRMFSIQADQVVNASGAWAKTIAALAAIPIDMVYSKGSLVVTHKRVTQRVINRLRPSSNADILAPAGTVSILGTTSIRIDSLNAVFPTVEEIDLIIAKGTEMLPVLATTPFIRAYAGVRPLLGTRGAADDRGISRSFALLDHCRQGVKNFVTITGGKLTTYRLMAEKTADLICQRMGIPRQYHTRTAPLASPPSARWTTPGLSSKLWLRSHALDDILLCECEMVSKSVVDNLIASIREQGGAPDFESLGLRSRIGKGICQGTFCSIRLSAYLYDIGELHADQGLRNLCAFLNERWRGVRPLLQDNALIHAELLEAIHCGLFGLELIKDKKKADA